ncbi:MAG: NAD(P)/FAD-dependent oxidoreductase [Vicinamibacterales bacterium]
MIVVVGGGLNGLVAGAVLARRGRPVTILDQRPVVGGTAITTEFAPGFHAPTLSHAFGPVAGDVLAALGLDAEALDLVAPDPPVTVIGPAGAAARVCLDDEATGASLRPVSSHDARQWRGFARAMRAIGGVLRSIDRHPPPDLDRPSATDLFRLLGAGRAARGLGRDDLARLLRYVPMAVADVAAEWFESDVMQAAVCALALHGHLAGPWSAGTGLLLLQRVAAEDAPLGRAVTARGGPGAVTARIADVARRAGAVVRTDARVARIETADHRVTGVTLEGGESIAATAVVAAIDPRQVYLDLLPPDVLAPSVRDGMRHYRARGVTMKVNLALDEAPAFTAIGGDARPLAGRVLVVPDVDGLERAFDAAKYGEPSPEPWLDVTVPTVADPSLAPAGRHVMSVVAHFAPRALATGSWDTRRDEVVRAVVDRLEAEAPGLRARIAGTEALTPEDLERRWALPGGHIFHGEMTLDQWWVARPLLGSPGVRGPIGGLVLAGAGTHPGGGLTGWPGLLAARAVLEIPVK